MVKPASPEKHEKKDALNEGIRFLGIMLASALVLYFLLSPLEPVLQTIESTHVRAVLRMVGVPTHDAPISNQFWVGEKQIEISPLCSGLVEMVLLAGAILATCGASMKKKIKGIVVGILVLYAGNLARITITVLQLRYSSLEFAAFTHDILFRVTLILGFALIYAGWVHFARVKAWLVAQNMLGG